MSRFTLAYPALANKFFEIDIPYEIDKDVEYKKTMKFSGYVPSLMDDELEDKLKQLTKMFERYGIPYDLEVGSKYIRYFRVSKGITYSMEAKPYEYIEDLQTIEGATEVYEAYNDKLNEEYGVSYQDFDEGDRLQI